jgi:hypothetical protein
MARRVFISYQHTDQSKAKGFNLMRYNKNLDLNFVGRHLLDPVNSENQAYISSKIKEQITGSSVTIVLIGKNTAQSEWVQREVEWSLGKKPPNGLLGIRLSPDAATPDELTEQGAEILNWYEPDDVHEFQDAIERAAVAARLSQAMPINSSGTCSR